MLKPDNSRVLFIKQSSLGDIIHTLPLVHGLKRSYPDCSIGWVVQKAFAPILELDASVSDIYPIDIPSTSEPGAGNMAYFHALRATTHTLRKLRRSFRTLPYDYVLDLHASFRSGMLALMNPGGKRIGFSDAKELNPLFQHVRVANPDNLLHAVDRNLLFCQHLSFDIDDRDFYVCTQKPEEESVERFLKEQGIFPGQKIVYANPAARWQSKFWLAPYWADLADRLHGRGVPLIFCGSSHDIPYIDEIGEEMSSEAIVAAGQLSLTESVALMKRSNVYVGLDSGPMHIAAMTQTPVVALFGPTHPERVGPYGTRNEIIQAESIDCLCCRKRVCSHMWCMKAITVDRVYRAVRSLMTDDGKIE